MIKLLLAFFFGVGLAVLAFMAKPLLAPPPPSVHVSAEAAQAAVATRKLLAPHMIELMTADITVKRSIIDQYFYAPKINEARQLYPVTESVLEIDGVYTEVFTPAEGIPPQNAHRVLINLHGGGFALGARTEGRLESIPVASVAGIRVISIDYRQGPEHRFPAASEDVAKVYRHLLQTYTPEQIGIFGCSAGGLLTAQSVAWFNAHGLPTPGAVGIFCAGAGKFGTGDAGVIADTFGSSIGVDDDFAYFAQADWNSALVAPQEHPNVLERFPPTLLITSTRDFAMSSTLVTHQRLVEAGVDAELHVYEGLGHYFFADTGLPESRHVFDVIARFFDQELAAAEPLMPTAR
ncbi:acetyl esterase/lipase [Marinobacterium halophilum]|uniref:Acetyl esterase/lipase n=2 Tax=Marinobacterium halophilum TaxID=267374 RepID=A0A2P8EQH2_9GAMM|nr:acetyl esterase/lipase [Marinobacterium halophilum]